MQIFNRRKYLAKKTAKMLNVSFSTLFGDFRSLIIFGDLSAFLLATFTPFLVLATFGAYPRTKKNGFLKKNLLKISLRKFTFEFLHRSIPTVRKQDHTFSTHSALLCRKTNHHRHMYKQAREYSVTEITKIHSQNEFLWWLRHTIDDGSLSIELLRKKEGKFQENLQKTNFRIKPTIGTTKNKKLLILLTSTVGFPFAQN